MEFISGIARPGFVGKVVVDFTVTDGELAFDFTLAQTGGNDFAADLFAKFLVIHSVRFQPGAELDR